MAAWWLGGQESNTNVPVAATDVVAIAAGNGVSLAVKRDGTIVEWSGSALNYYHDCGQLIAPAGVSNVVAVACGKGDDGSHNLALFSAEPIIRLQPQSRSVIAGDNVQFSVVANSPGAITFQWRFNGTQP